MRPASRRARSRSERTRAHQDRSSRGAQPLGRGREYRRRARRHRRTIAARPLRWAAGIQSTGRTDRTEPSSADHSRPARARPAAAGTSIGPARFRRSAPRRGVCRARADEAVLHLWQAGDEAARAVILERPVRSGAESFIAGTASCRHPVRAATSCFASSPPEVLHPVAKDGCERPDFGSREFATLDLDGNLVSSSSGRPRLRVRGSLLVPDDGDRCGSPLQPDRPESGRFLAVTIPAGGPGTAGGRVAGAAQHHAAALASEDVGPCRESSCGATRPRHTPTRSPPAAGRGRAAGWVPRELAADRARPRRRAAVDGGVLREQRQSPRDPRHGLKCSWRRGRASSCATQAGEASSNLDFLSQFFTRGSARRPRRRPNAPLAGSAADARIDARSFERRRVGPGRDAQARAGPGARPAEARIRRPVRHAQREGAHAPWRLLRQRLPGPHGFGDGNHPQRDHLRKAAAQHGLVG